MGAHVPSSPDPASPARRSIRSVRRALLALPLLVAPLAAVRGQSAPVPPLDAARLARVDAVFDSIGPDRPGYALGIVRDGRLVHARGFGAADLEQGVAIGPRTVFNVASLSKQFTAACIAILVRRGALSLEDDVRAHVPAFPARFGAVKVKHLVYMTSGLPEYYGLPRPGGRTWDRDYFEVPDAIGAVLAQPRLEFEPGTRWAYSNVNYMLLAEIVARRSGMPFSEFARREIFAPLGMHDTHVNDDLSRLVPRRATGYNAREGGGWRREIRRSPHYGGSGVHTTVEDLARWDRSFETHQLGGPELTALLLSTMRFRHAKANDAFGLVWGERAGRRTLWYEGGDLGFSSYMVRLPDDRLTVIVLSNLGTGRAAERAGRVLDVLLAR
jgi:CubicO group peptidase (beta-lactamase class C family)